MATPKLVATSALGSCQCSFKSAESFFLLGAFFFFVFTILS